MRRQYQIKSDILDRLSETPDKHIESTRLQRAADCNHRQVRLAVLSLIEDGIAIVSCNYGFKIATSWGEVNLVLKDLAARSAAMHKRIHSLISAALNSELSR